MVDKPRVVITSSNRRQNDSSRGFTFTEAELPADTLIDQRRSAWQTYVNLPVPSAADEAWKRTDLRSMPADAFRLPAKTFPRLPLQIPEYLIGSQVSDGRAGHVFFSPGSESVSELDDKLGSQGVIFTDLRTAQRDHALLLKDVLGRIVEPTEGKFAALSSALAEDGILLYVPKNVHVEAPLLSILWGAGSGLAHFSRLIIWIEAGASVTYMHESASSDEDDASLHAGIVEIHVGENADLKFVELQSWGRKVWNFSHERARVGKDARLDWIFGAVGSRLTKNFTELSLEGEGAQGRMSGFYFTDGEQHLDHDTQQNHLAPHTTSDLLFKGALKGHSRSVWQGMIYVAPGAQKTDGYQANRNLVLSPDARADSIPGLEILADDVRCTHGATVGRLEAEPLFYLKSRGIPDQEAERLLVEGFFDPIMQRIPFEGVRARFQQSIHRKMQPNE